LMEIVFILIQDLFKIHLNPPVYYPIFLEKEVGIDSDRDEIRLHVLVNYPVLMVILSFAFVLLHLVVSVEIKILLLVPLVVIDVNIVSALDVKLPPEQKMILITMIWEIQKMQFFIK